MYKKKTSSSPSFSTRYAPQLASLLTLLLVLTAEYLFSVPSTWLHGSPPKWLSTTVLSEWLGSEEDILCTQEYAPVCGRDGRTYSNSCMIKAAGVAVARVGRCVPAEDPIITESRDTEEIIITGSLFPEELILTGEVVSSGVLNFDPASYQIYTNNTFKYSLALPKYAYYQGSVSPDKKSHILAVGLSATGVEDIATAPIRVRYYSDITGVDTATKMIPLQRGGLTLDIEGTVSPKLQAIIDAIVGSAKSF